MAVNGFKRAKETMAVAFFMISSFGTPLCWMFSIMLLFSSPWTSIPMILYLSWMLLGPGQPIQERSWKKPLRRWSLWKHFVDYFPMKLIRTVELDPQKTYIFCYHPHGVICLGGWGNFVTDATGFEQAFPGIDLHVLTLKMNLRAPFLRTYLHLHGISDVSQETCKTILRRGPGSSIFLAVGGALESLESYPGEYCLVLKQRKGFVRVALQTGSSLVPIISFGETDAFLTRTPRRGTPERDKLMSFYRRFGVVFPPIKGDIWHLFGFLPRRKPITSVVGEPIEIPFTEGTKGDPAFEAQVDLYHELYLERLRDLWDRYKEVYAYHRVESMQFTS